MKTNSTTPPGARDVLAGDAWFDPIEAGIRGRIRGFIETMLEEELAAALGRGRYEAATPRGTGTASASGSCLARSARSSSRCRGRG